MTRIAQGRRIISVSKDADENLPHNPVCCLRAYSREPHYADAIVGIHDGDARDQDVGRRWADCQSVEVARVDLDFRSIVQRELHRVHTDGAAGSDLAWIRVTLVHGLGGAEYPCPRICQGGQLGRKDDRPPLSIIAGIGGRDVKDDIVGSGACVSVNDGLPETSRPVVIGDIDGQRIGVGMPGHQPEEADGEE